MKQLFTALLALLILQTALVAGNDPFEEGATQPIPKKSKSPDIVIPLEFLIPLALEFEGDPPTLKYRFISFVEYHRGLKSLKEGNKEEGLKWLAAATALGNKKARIKLKKIWEELPSSQP